jgi:hypothetical protein
MKTFINTENMFVRVYGRLVPISQVSFVQLNPNDSSEIVQEIPLTEPIQNLVNNNLENFIKVKNDWTDL